jgi:hypothetical protein
MHMNVNFLRNADKKTRFYEMYVGGGFDLIARTDEHISLHFVFADLRPLASWLTHAHVMGCRMVSKWIE